MVSGDERGFVCLWKHCGKSFHRNSDLRRHYRIHTDERPYRCGVKDCNKGFIQRSALTVHSRTHTGEKPFRCSYEGCHSKFSDSSSLARHRGIHIGERAYVCPEPMCKRSFRRKATLMNHQHSTHTLDFAIQTLSEAMATPEKEKPYLTPITIPRQTDPHPYSQQEYWCWSSPNTAIATHCFNFYLDLPFTLPTAPAAIQESRPVLLYNNYSTSVPAWVPELPHPQEYTLQSMQQEQQYLELFQQQTLQCGQGLAGMEAPIRPFWRTPLLRVVRDEADTPLNRTRTTTLAPEQLSEATIY